MELYLLNKDDACNFEVLDYILHQGNLKATKVDLMETFKLSTYKMDKAINSLNADLMEIATSDVVVEIKEISLGVFQGIHLDNKAIHDLGAFYLRQSAIYLAFEYRFIFQYLSTKVSYLSRLFLSNSPFYEAEEKLDQLLNEHEFFVSLNKKSDEFAIRQHLFQIYFESFPNPNCKNKLATR